MKISWTDLEFVDTPGEFPFLDGTITIRQRYIDIWKERPDAVFTIVSAEPISGPKEYALGAYELPPGRESPLTRMAFAIPDVALVSRQPL